MLVHILVLVSLTGLAMVETGSTDPGRWEQFVRYRVRDINYGSFFIKHTLLRIQVVCYLQFHYTLFAIHCLPQ